MKYENRSHVYSEEELQTLSKDQNRLILFYGNIVLDVTDYRHPGGQYLFT